MKTILLIEDNTDMRENITEILELADYQVIAAENGKVGLAQLKIQIPDLIICDIMMPELDGYGVLHVVSKKPETAGIPFIFLSAKTEKNDIRRGMNLGADDYLSKPFDDSELLDAVETRLKKNAILKKEFQRNISGLEEFMNEARSLDALNELSKDRDVRSYKNKDIIYSEGGFPNKLFFINKGKVKICKINDDGKELILSIAREGAFIGYLALLQNRSYQESAIALENVEVCIIPKEDYLAMIFNNKDVSTKFIKMLSNNIVEKEAQLLELAYSSVRQRVAGALLTLQKAYKNDNTGSIDILISRNDLARMVGTAKETLIRTLTDFKEESLIEIKGNDFKILDDKKLTKVHESVF